MNANFSSAKKSSWPKQAAIVISDSPNVHMMLRELLRTYSWTVIDSTPSVEHAAEVVRQGQAFLIITDDTLQVPAIRHVRYLLSDPITICTPVLSFLLETHKSDAPSLQKMGRPYLVDKPLTPAKFIPGFVELVRAWEKEPLLTLRRANYQFLSGHNAQGIRAFAKLMENDAVGSLAAQAIALHLRYAGKVKEAETILLSALKRAPRELGTMIVLAELYMRTAMPKLAHRLLLGARSTFGQSLAMVPDLVQASIMMGRVDDAIENLQMLVKAGHSDEDTLTSLARLLFVEGREAEAERVLLDHRTAFKRLQAAWVQAESQPVNAAS